MMWFDPSVLRWLPVRHNVEDYLFAIQGRVYREQPGRRTLAFEREGRSYFLKLHRGVGWREIVKNLLALRLPVIGARNEWRAILRLQALGVPTMRLVGYGRKGFNPARQKSFVMTERLAGTVSLEELCEGWGRKKPPPALKRALIRQVADTARLLHQNGINHRDFYLCHFLLSRDWLDAGRWASPPLLYLIDLHRAQIRRRTPRRWLVKDIGGLYYSACDAGLTRRDLLRFMTRYRGKTLRQTLRDDRAFWIAVGRRAKALYRESYGAGARFPLPADRAGAP